MFNLHGKVALVTGGGSGIGESIAKLYASAGATVYIGEINRQSGQRVVNDIRAAGGVAEFVELNVANEDLAKHVARTVLGQHGRCDILVNNAGIGHVGTVLTTAGDDLDRLYAVNVKGVFHMTKAILPAMIERKSGSIINIASVAGIVGVRDRLAYTMTKFAVVGITKAVALDHAESKVRCNAICPGRVETPFVQARLREYPDPKKAYEDMSNTQALKRMGKPEEVAAAALYLASDEAAFVTGSTLVLDGGWCAGK